MLFEREVGMSLLFERAAVKFNNSQIKTMKFNTKDRGCEDPAMKEYSMCYNKTIPGLKQFCGPDCFFQHWPSACIKSFEEMVTQIKAAPLPTISKIGWVGNIHSPEPDVIEYKTRPLLKQIGDAYPDMFEIIHVSPISDIIDTSCPKYVSLPDLMKYKYLIDIGGNGWSGRLKFLLFSRRPLLMVDRKYIEYFYTDLIPNVHYIPVKEDLSDLLTQAKWVFANEAAATQIAENAYNYAVHNLTEAKLSERINEVYQTVGK